MARVSRQAELRAGFERLKSGDVENVPQGTPVTQNNVARETGMEPSSFKKSRYPLLIDEIQRYISDTSQVASKSPGKPKAPKPKPDDDMLVKNAIAERDLAVSKLMIAQVRIIELTKILSDYEAAEQDRLGRRRH